MGTQTNSETLADVQILEDVNYEEPRGERISTRSLQSGLFVGNNSVATSAKVYKRRWVGLFQLAVMNIIISWAWLTYSPISGTAAQFLNVDETDINWLSIGFLFAFSVAAPPTIWIMNRFGTKASMMVASLLVLAGNWLRFGAIQLDEDVRFAVTVVGQVIIGLGQPFVLSAPVHYADLWFPPSGRVTATALATLANPIGGAISQLVGPIWVTKPSLLPNYILFVSGLSSIAALPSFFIRARPPGYPPTYRAQLTPSAIQELRTLVKLSEFWLMFVPFTALIGAFTSFSSLLNQILVPHGFTDTQAGITGAILILAGLTTAAILSPIIDHSAAHLFAIKLGIPLLAMLYLLFLWAPSSGSIIFVDICAGLIGALSFSLLPIGLEFVADVTHPIAVELSSTTFWAGGQLLGGILMICVGSLKASSTDKVPNSLDKGLVIHAGFAAFAMPFAIALGFFGRQEAVLVRRGIRTR